MTVLGQGVGARPGSSAQAESLRSNLGAVVSLPVTLLGAPVSIATGQ